MKKSYTHRGSTLLTSTGLIPPSATQPTTNYLMMTGALKSSSNLHNGDTT